MKLHRAFVFRGRERAHHHDGCRRRQQGGERMGFDDLIGHARFGFPFVGLKLFRPSESIVD